MFSSSNSIGSGRSSGGCQASWADRRTRARTARPASLRWSYVAPSVTRPISQHGSRGRKVPEALGRSMITIGGRIAQKMHEELS